MFVSDKCLELLENFMEFYPEAKWQRCVVHFYRNVWTAVPLERLMPEIRRRTRVLGAFPDRHFRPDASGSPAKACCRYQVGHQMIPANEPTG
jgi:transposase-like protein